MKLPIKTQDAIKLAYRYSNSPDRKLILRELLTEESVADVAFLLKLDPAYVQRYASAS